MNDLAAAALLPTRECIARTRELLADPAIAADAAAWVQLAAAALRARHMEDAADAAAEGLALDGDHEVLLELVRRARGDLEVPGRARSWQAASDLLIGFGPDVVGAAATVVEIWSVEGTHVKRLDVGSTVTSLAAIGDQVAIGTAEGDIHLWQPTTGRHDVRETEPMHTHAQAQLGSQAAMGFGIGGGSIEQYPELMAELEPRKLPVIGVAFDERGELISSNEARVSWWERGRCTAGVNVAAGLLQAAGRRAIVAQHDGLAERERDGATYALAPARVTALQARDGVVLGGCNDGTIVRFAGRTARLPLLGHTGAVVALARGGDVIVSASADETLRWWRDGHPIACVGTAARAVAITDDGTVVTAIDDELVTWTCERARAPRPPPRLEVRPEAGTTFAVQLGGDRTVFGRHTDCDVQLAHRQVAVEQLAITRAGDRYRIRDLSVMGTYVDRVRIVGDRELLDGDLIEMIGFEIDFEHG